MAGLALVKALTDSRATIAALEAENARLRIALKPFGLAADYWSAFHDFQKVGVLGSIEVGDLRRARAALKESSNG